MLFALVALLLILVSFVQLRHVLRRRRWDHFPGYSSFTSLPLIGHTHRMNLERPFDTILDLHKKYGPVVRFDYGNFPTVFIGDYHMAVEVQTQRLESSKLLNYHETCRPSTGMRSTIDRSEECRDTGA